MMKQTIKHVFSHKAAVVFFTAVLTFASFAGEGQAASHFEYNGETGFCAFIGVPSVINPHINGVPLEYGDEIGVFTGSGLCVGAGTWTGENIAITAWADDISTPEVDGFRENEPVMFRIWQVATGHEYSDVTATFVDGMGLFQRQGIYRMTSLRVGGDFAQPPLLLSPAHNDTVATAYPVFQWMAVGVGFPVQYDLKVVEIMDGQMPEQAADVNFPVFQERGISAVSMQYPAEALPLEPGKSYACRVRATNLEGDPVSFNNSYSNVTVFHTRWMDDDEFRTPVIFDQKSDGLEVFDGAATVSGDVAIRSEVYVKDDHHRRTRPANGTQIMLRPAVELENGSVVRADVMLATNESEGIRDVHRFGLSYVHAGGEHAAELGDTYTDWSPATLSGSRVRGLHYTNTQFDGFTIQGIAGRLQSMQDYSNFLPVYDRNVAGIRVEYLESEKYAAHANVITSYDLDGSLDRPELTYREQVVVDENGIPLTTLQTPVQRATVPVLSNTIVGLEGEYHVEEIPLSAYAEINMSFSERETETETEDLNGAAVRTRLNYRFNDGWVDAKYSRYGSEYMALGVFGFVTDRQEMALESGWRFDELPISLQGRIARTNDNLDDRFENTNVMHQVYGSATAEPMEALHSTLHLGWYSLTNGADGVDEINNSYVIAGTHHSYDMPMFECWKNVMVGYTFYQNQNDQYYVKSRKSVHHQLNFSTNYAFSHELSMMPAIYLTDSRYEDRGDNTITTFQISLRHRSLEDRLVNRLSVSRSYEFYHFSREHFRMSMQSSYRVGASNFLRLTLNTRAWEYDKKASVFGPKNLEDTLCRFELVHQF